MNFIDARGDISEGLFFATSSVSAFPTALRENRLRSRKTRRSYDHRCKSDKIYHNMQ